MGQVGVPLRGLGYGVGSPKQVSTFKWGSVFSISVGILKTILKG